VSESRYKTVTSADSDTLPHVLYITQDNEKYKLQHVYVCIEKVKEVCTVCSKQRQSCWFMPHYNDSKNTGVNHQGSSTWRMIILMLHSNNCIEFLFIKHLSGQSVNTSSHSFCLPVPQHVTSRPSLASLRVGW